MASNKYQEDLPDYRDLENQSGRRPGYTLMILENDGGVGIHMWPVNEDYDKTDGLHAVYLSAEQAEKLLQGLTAATEQARYKEEKSRRSRS